MTSLTQKTQKTQKIDVKAIHKEIVDTLTTRSQKAHDRNVLLQEMIECACFTRAQIFDALRMSYRVSDATINVALSDVKNAKYAKRYVKDTAKVITDENKRKVYTF